MHPSHPMSYSLANENFTIIAAFFCYVGCYSIAVAGKNNGKRSEIVAGVIALTIGTMIRVQVGCLFIPFVLLLFLEEIVEMCVAKKPDRNVFRFGIFLSVVLLLLVLANSIMAQEKYKEGCDYNSARSSIMDFPKQEYQEIADELKAYGISENDYNCVVKYILLDTERQNSQYLQIIADIVSVEKEISVSELKASFVNIVNKIMADGILKIRIVLLLLSTIYFFVFVRKRWVSKAVLILAWLGGTFILLYYQWQGRCPVRIITSIAFAVFFIISVEFEYQGGYI